MAKAILRNHASAFMPLGLFIALASVAVAISPALEARAAAIGAVKNIVLVHGANTDGSGWRGVYDILKKDGYLVSVVQEPLTGLSDDVAATKRVIDQQDGPLILVGHSYGGTIITVAGADPKVRALVYVAALQPDVGETTNQLAASMPGEVPSSDLKPTKDGFIFIDPNKFCGRRCDRSAPRASGIHVELTDAGGGSRVRRAGDGRRMARQAKLRDRRHSRSGAQSHACALDVQALRGKDN
jgi:pimeloyl-ACP methyl ester carboxylesterase